MEWSRGDFGGDVGPCRTSCSTWSFRLLGLIGLYRFEAWGFGIASRSRFWDPIPKIPQ